MKKSETLFLLFFVLICSAGKSQTFKHEFVTVPSEKTGFHRILLEPEQRRTMSSDLHDTRVFDASGKEIPYLFVEAQSKSTTQGFVTYPVLSRKHHENYSELILENKDLDNISNIAFNINNNDAAKFCAIEGSDDQKQWYVVSARQQMQLSNDHSKNNSYLSLSFPTNNYRYFKLLVEDITSAPVKINAAGTFTYESLTTELLDVPCTFTFKEVKRKKITEVQLDLSNNIVHEFRVEVSSPRHFNRAMTVWKTEVVKRKHKTETVEIPLGQFQLVSGAENTFSLGWMREEKLILRIDNADNPPLEIKNIVFRQLPAYLVCELDSGSYCTVKSGNLSLNQPRYDIAAFVRNPMELPTLAIKDTKPLPQAATETKEEKFIETKTFMWLCIALGILTVGLFAFSLVRDLRKERAKNVRESA